MELTKLPITLVCICRNAVERIQRLVDKHKDVVSEIVIIDQDSIDGTYEKATEIADLVIRRRNKGTADPDRNFAFGIGSQPYVLYLDDDEYLSDETIENLKHVIDTDADIYWFKRTNLVDGIDIDRITGDDIQCRLFKRGAVSFPDRIHQYPSPANGAIVAYMDYSIIHDRTYDGLVKANKSRESIANENERRIQDEFIAKVDAFLKTGLRGSR